MEDKKEEKMAVQLKSFFFFLEIRTVGAVTNKDSDKYFLPFTRLSVCLTNFLKQSPVTQAIIPVTADREAEVAGHKGTPCFHTARVVDGTHLLLPG